MKRDPVVIVVDKEDEVYALDTDPEALDRLIAEGRFEAQGMALATYRGRWLFRWLTPWRAVRSPADAAYAELTPEEREAVDGVLAGYPGAYAVVALAATVPRGRG